MSKKLEKLKQKEEGLRKQLRKTLNELQKTCIETLQEEKNNNLSSENIDFLSQLVLCPRAEIESTPDILPSFLLSSFAGWVISGENCEKTEVKAFLQDIPPENISKTKAPVDFDR